MSFRRPAALAAIALAAATAGAAEPAAVNLRLGTQAFEGLYAFTTNPPLVEIAGQIRAMGSDILKFRLAPSSSPRTPPFAPGVTSLVTLARDEPSVRRVLDMPFRHILAWVYSFPHGREMHWTDGLSPAERADDYAQVFDLTRHLLTNYAGTGKAFYLGHWEGDWHLLPGYGTKNATRTNPPAVRIRGMRDWLATRQQAVDDARRATPHAGVEVYHYAEVNRVRDAMRNPADRNQRVVNAVLPFVTNLDFVSWSAYDGQELPGDEFACTLDYIEAHLPTNKAAAIRGRRVFIGEYGFGGRFPPDGQEAPTRALMAKAVRWGCPFVLFWQMYNNEEGRHFGLVDPSGAHTPCFELHRRFLAEAGVRAAAFRARHGRDPDDREFADLALPLLGP
ncbi:MAG: hypothetical protein FJ221_13875 [Lentisphaerae bacterium]|nr:hypothetical protein [Lentisphaerota bacterium]